MLLLGIYSYKFGVNLKKKEDAKNAERVFKDLKAYRFAHIEADKNLIKFCNMERFEIEELSNAILQKETKKQESGSQRSLRHAKPHMRSKRDSQTHSRMP